MISLRTLKIIGIILVVLCAGIFFYSSHSNRKFAEQLTTHPVTKNTVENTLDKTQENIHATPDDRPLQGTQKGVKLSDTPAADKIQIEKRAKSPVEFVVEKHEPHSQSDIDTHFDDAFAFFDDYSVFESINIDATRAALAEMLSALHGDDPRVSEFLGSWDSTSRIFSLRAEYRKSGATDANLREQIFEMKPTEVVPKAFELGSELMQPSETVATQRSEWLQEWVELVSKAEMAHFSAVLAKEAYDHGEISAQEAENFIEEVSGLDVRVREVEVTDE